MLSYVFSCFFFHFSSHHLALTSGLKWHFLYMPTWWIVMAFSVMQFQYQGYKIKINLPKGNYWILRIGLMGSVSSLQKSEFVNLIISFFHYFWCQNWDQWHKMSGKNTHIYFFYFRFKNKRVWAERIPISPSHKIQ